MFITLDSLKEMLKKSRRHPAPPEMPTSDASVLEDIKGHNPKFPKGSRVFY